MDNFMDKSFDLDNAGVISSLDELSLWSAPFGLMMLDHIPIRKNMKVLDMGFGLGFPLLELAQRLGNTCKIYGIDPWRPAMRRAREKAEIMGIGNIQLVEGDAANMEFEDNMFDLIVSNTGINNFEDPIAVLKESFRVMAPDGVIALTTNPVGHMAGFYEVYEDTLKELDLENYLEKLAAQRDHRLSPGTICLYLQQAGFTLGATHRRQFRMRFADGTAFFNHSLILIGFLEGWKSILPEEQHKRVFMAMEKKLNKIAKEKGEWSVTIPTLYVEAEKPQNG